MSRGFDPPGCPDKPLVSYQINRQLPGWNLPPLVTRAVWAHWEMRAEQTFRPPIQAPHRQTSPNLDQAHRIHTQGTETSGFFRSLLRQIGLPRF